jgi:hypothetical protein
VKGFAELATGAAERGLRFLVSGGQAVNALGYQRVTLDLDIVVPRSDRERWLVYLEAVGYTLFADGGGFLQLTPPRSTLSPWPLDLMLTDGESFDRLWDAARAATLEGVPTRIVAPMHMIAMKIHALRGGAEDRHPKDYQDIVGILRVQGIDPRSGEVAELFRRYGTIDWYERVLESFPPASSGR